MKCNFIRGIRKLATILILSICSMTMISCSGKDESFKLKDGTESGSINLSVPENEKITIN